MRPLRAGMIVRCAGRGAVCLAAALAASGCLKARQVLTLNPDGSGTYDLAYAVSEQAIAQMKAVARVREQMAVASGNPLPPARERDLLDLLLNPSEDRIRAEVGKYEKNGIVLESFRMEARETWRHVSLKARFKSLALLAKADFFAEHGFSLARRPDGSYLFRREARAEGVGAALDLSDPATVALLSPVMKGFRVEAEIRTPGRILKTNAPRKAEYSAGWVFDFDADPNALMAVQNHVMDILFSGGGLSLPEVRTGPANN